MSLVEPDYIIAIGASAGGLEEILSFFDHTPLDGVSYIIIQHLSPDYTSKMRELVARHSKLVIKDAENGMRVMRNEVYLIPNNKFMTICNNRLFLTYKEKAKGPHLTINRFLNSLAGDSGKKAIAVVLSGMGSDGTEGIKAIKKAGGLVICRKPEGTEFASMPSHAIATGLVDFVLEPEEMPEAIQDYVQHEGELVERGLDDEKNVGLIVNVLKEHLPFDFSEYKQSTILRRIKRRAASHSFTSLEEYTAFLATSPEEMEILVQDFLISVTSFFRDRESFEFLEKEVFPKIVENVAPGEELKMWVAGCATGEEAYSIAILIYRLLKNRAKNTIVKIFATDIDALALIHAGKGVYDAGITKHLSPDWLERYFIKEGESYRILPEVRRMVIFARHDLVKNPPYCNMQFISCRNLLIYMTPVLQKKIFPMLLFGLKAEGHLFLGSSENPAPILDKLETVHKKYKIYKNLQIKQSIRFDSFTLPEATIIKHAGNPVLKVNTASTISKMNFTIDEALNEDMAGVLDHLLVYIDENGQVVKTYGDTKKYLIQQNFNSNLSELLPRPLDIAFSTLRNTALKTNERAVASAIEIRQDKAALYVDLVVAPIKLNKEGHKLLMVVFTESRSGQAAGKPETAFDAKTYQDQYILNLEEELKEMKGKLSLSDEMLDASNENLQSFNEELLSANEEMQSTNEEMQSVNEELHTINADYQAKNKELQELNDDLSNYFRSNINGQLFVNTDLLLLKFSPGAVKLINLIDSDIGRPISNITTNIKLETLVDDIKSVLREDLTITREIQTNNGRWYQVMTMPYLQQPDQRIAGAILTFNDVTELKIIQLELDKKNKSLLRINADLNNFVHAASHDLLAPLANIEGSISIINKITVADPQLNKFLAIINFSVRKFRTLIKDIATIAKIENDVISMETVDLREVMGNVEWSLENKIKQSGAVINKAFEVEQVYFSKKNFRSIIYNLVSNAIKFKGEHPPVINIHSAKIGDETQLSIQDNGKGIPAEGMDKIFDMYGRLHPDVEGHGIGLYLARKIIHAAGGSIVVESEVGKGSKFTICFKEHAE
jgi:two-component system CheB/CheR fusion protein